MVSYLKGPGSKPAPVMSETPQQRSLGHSWAMKWLKTLVKTLEFEMFSYLKSEWTGFLKLGHFCLIELWIFTSRAGQVILRHHLLLLHQETFTTFDLPDHQFWEFCKIHQQFFEMFETFWNLEIFWFFLTFLKNLNNSALFWIKPI